MGMGKGNGAGCLPAPPLWLCASSLLRGRRRAARLVLWGGECRAARHGTQAGEVMLQLELSSTGTVVCRADAFYLGRPAPVLAIEDRLVAGETYLALPVDRLPRGGHDALTAAALAALSYGGPGGRRASIAGAPRSPFEYVKGDGGRTVIKVTPEFLVAAVTAPRPSSRDSRESEEEDADAGALCSTPELRKHYEQLVGAARGRPWSPRLDTIKEQRRPGFAAAAVSSPAGGRLSPVAVARLLGLHHAGKGGQTT